MDVSTSTISSNKKARDNNESTSGSTELEKTPTVIVSNDRTNNNNNNKNDNINLGIARTTKNDKKDEKMNKSKVTCNGERKKGSKYYKQLIKNGKKMYQCRNCTQIYGSAPATHKHYVTKHTTRFQCIFKDVTNVLHQEDT